MTIDKKKNQRYNKDTKSNREEEKMYLISAKNIYTVVTLINRLPDRYLKNGNLYDGVYNTLGKDELEKICSRGIKL